jgi:fibronectin-binding autotransporter adhesin
VLAIINDNRPPIHVVGGTLEAIDSGLGTLTSVATSTTLDAGTFLDFNGWNSTINNLQGAGTLANITDDVSASLGTTTILQGNFAGSIVSGNLVKSGAGLLILGGANSYTGFTTISGGILQVGAASALGSDATKLLTLSSGGTLRTTGTFSLANPFALGSGGGVFNTDALTTLTLSGAGSGAGSLTKAGAGTLVLTGATNRTGGTTISAGTLQLSGAATLGSGLITLNGGSLRATEDRLLTTRC